MRTFTASVMVAAAAVLGVSFTAAASGSPNLYYHTTAASSPANPDLYYHI